MPILPTGRYVLRVLRNALLLAGNKIQSQANAVASLRSFDVKGVSRRNYQYSQPDVLYIYLYMYIYVCVVWQFLNMTLDIYEYVHINVQNSLERYRDT